MEAGMQTNGREWRQPRHRRTKNSGQECPRYFSRLTTHSL